MDVWAPRVQAAFDVTEAIGQTNFVSLLTINKGNGYSKICVGSRINKKTDAFNDVGFKVRKTHYKEVIAYFNNSRNKTGIKPFCDNTSVFARDKNKAKLSFDMVLL